MFVGGSEWTDCELISIKTCNMAIYGSYLREEKTEVDVPVLIMANKEESSMQPISYPV